jgi:hypothetical protein
MQQEMLQCDYESAAERSSSHGRSDQETRLLAQRRVAEAKIKEAEAQTSKLRYEAEHWKQQNKLELLRQRT